MGLCGITSGIDLPCKKARGGTREIYLANFDDVTITPVYGAVGSPGGDAGYVTNITMAPGTYFYKFIPTMMSSNLTGTISTNLQNNSVQVEDKVSMTFAGLTAANRNTINTLIDGTLIAVIRDFNGELVIAGEFNGLQLSEGTYGTGTAGTDLSGYTLTLSGFAYGAPRLIDQVYVTIDDLLEP